MPPPPLMLHVARLLVQDFNRLATRGIQEEDRQADACSPVSAIEGGYRGSCFLLQGGGQGVLIESCRYCTR